MKQTRRLVLMSAFLAVLINVFWISSFRIIRPLHATGPFEGIATTWNRLAHIVWAPGGEIARHTVPGWFHMRMPAIAYMACFNFITYFVGFMIIGRIFQRAFLPRGSCPDISVKQLPQQDTPPNNSPGHPLLTRRDFLAKSTAGVVGLGALSGAALGGYSGFIAPQDVRVRRYVLPVRDLPGELEGIIAAHLSDIHHGPWITRNYVKKVVSLTNSLSPDIVFLTGDYVSESEFYFAGVAEELGRLTPRIGCVAVLGNHDWWEGADIARKQFNAVGIPLIDNHRMFLGADRKLTGDVSGLCIAGVGDLWEDQVLFDQALVDVPDNMPRLVLSHNPDVAEKPSAGGRRIDLMFCGHMHGGQVRLPVIGAPMVPSRYGQKYAYGFIKGPHFPVYSTSGLGMAGMPVRLGMPPEIALFELRRPA